LPDSADLAARAMPTAQADPLGTARNLVDFALQAGGSDNITVVVAPFPPATSLAANSADPASQPPTQPGPRSDDE
jgi:serine/threonine protein phosphatase PrpC